MSSKDQKLHLLAGVPLFVQLGKHELQRVGQLADVLDLPAGRILMRQGERGAEAVVIVEGRASVERDGHLLYEAGPGDVLGEMALLSDRPRIATVTLLTDTRLLVLARREFDALMTEMPSVRAQVMENLAMRLMAVENSATH